MTIQRRRTLTIFHQIRRCISTSSPRQGVSPLFALGALSNSRESKWLSKASGISPVEFSPQLQLIRSSEGLDQSLREPATRPSVPNITIRPARRRSSTSARLDTHALRIGYAALERHKQASEHFQRAVRTMRTKHARQIQDWRNLNSKLRKETRIATFWVVVSISVATIAALWRVTPESKSVDINKKAQSLWRSRLLSPQRDSGEEGDDDATPLNELFAEAEANTELQSPLGDERAAKAPAAVEIPVEKPKRSWLWASAHTEGS